jgi:hypothetical protein
MDQALWADELFEHSGHVLLQSSDLCEVRVSDSVGRFFKNSATSSYVMV